MNERLEAASIKSCHAKCDDDVPIVLEVLVTKYATNKATTLVGYYTDSKDTVYALISHFMYAILD